MRVGRFTTPDPSGRPSRPAPLQRSPSALRRSHSALRRSHSSRLLLGASPLISRSKTSLESHLRTQFSRKDRMAPRRKERDTYENHKKNLYARMLVELIDPQDGFGAFSWLPSRILDRRKKISKLKKVLLEHATPLGAYLNDTELDILSKACSVVKFQAGKPIDESPFYLVLSGKIVEPRAGACPLTAVKGYLSFKGY